ncbi:MAG: hypothetical protein V4695_04860 [Pseudomonadota bacterium]
MKVNPGPQGLQPRSEQPAEPTDQASSGAAGGSSSNSGPNGARQRPTGLSRPGRRSLSTLPSELMNQIADHFPFGAKEPAAMLIASTGLRDGLKARVLADKLIDWLRSEGLRVAQVNSVERSAGVLLATIDRAAEHLRAGRLPANLFIKVIQQVAEAIPAGCLNRIAASVVLFKVAKSTEGLARDDDRYAALDTIASMFSREDFRNRMLLPPEPGADTAADQFYQRFTGAIQDLPDTVAARLLAKTAAGLYMIDCPVSRTSRWHELFGLQTPALLPQRPQLLQSLAFALPELQPSLLQQSAIAALLAEAPAAAPQVQMSILHALHEICCHTTLPHAQRALFDRIDMVARALPEAQKSVIYCSMASELTKIAPINRYYVYKTIGNAAKLMVSASCFDALLTVRTEALLEFPALMQFDLFYALTEEFEAKLPESRLSGLTTLLKTIHKLPASTHLVTCMSACLQIIPTLPESQRAQAYDLAMQTASSMPATTQGVIHRELHGHIEKESPTFAAENLPKLVCNVQLSHNVAEVLLLYRKLTWSLGKLPVSEQLPAFRRVLDSVYLWDRQSLVDSVMTRVFNHIARLPEAERRSFAKESMERFAKKALELFHILRRNRTDLNPARRIMSICNSLQSWQQQAERHTFVLPLSAQRLATKLLDGALEGGYQAMPDLLSQCRRFLPDSVIDHYQHLIERPALPAP